MTVCTHGQTAEQGCIWCPKKSGGTEYETNYFRDRHIDERLLGRGLTVVDDAAIGEWTAEIEGKIAGYRQDNIVKESRSRALNEALIKRVAALEAILADRATPQEPPGESQDNCDTIATSGSEPFDLRRKLNEAMQIPTNPKMYEGPFGLDPTDVRVHNVLSVLRSTAFREWANGRVWIEAKIDGDGWDVLFGEVES